MAVITVCTPFIGSSIRFRLHAKVTFSCNYCSEHMISATVYDAHCLRSLRILIDRVAIDQSLFWLPKALFLSALLCFLSATEVFCHMPLCCKNSKCCHVGFCKYWIRCHTSMNIHELFLPITSLLINHLLFLFYSFYCSFSCFVYAVLYSACISCFVGSTEQISFSVFLSPK